MISMFKRFAVILFASHGLDRDHGNGVAREGQCSFKLCKKTMKEGKSKGVKSVGACAVNGVRR